MHDKLMTRQFAVQKAFDFIEKNLFSKITPKAKPFETPVIAADLTVSQRAESERQYRTIFRYYQLALHVCTSFTVKKPPLFIQLILTQAIADYFFNGVPDYASTNNALQLCQKSKHYVKFSPFVKAVVSKALEADLNKHTETISGFANKEFNNLLRAQYGKETLKHFNRIFLNQPPIDIYIKKKPSKRKWLRAFNEYFAERGLPDVTILNEHHWRISQRVKITDLPGYDQGDWWIQDVSASFAVDWLLPRHGETVVDFCAAPGGKAMQIAQTGAKTIALDISQKRLERLYENFERCQLKADFLAIDALDWRPKEPVDAVLVDVPCTSSGLFRRHPEITFKSPLDLLKQKTALQQQLFAHAVDTVKPKGRIMFCTCSLFHQEGEILIKQFFRQHPIRLLQLTPIPPLPKQAIVKGYARLRPDYLKEIGGMDGFFIALFQKTD